MFRHAIAAILFAGTPVATTAQNASLFCSGQGRMISGNVTGIFPTHVATVPNSSTDDPASVEVLDCGNSIVVGVHGHRLVLAPLIFGTGWTGTLDIDGFLTDFHFEHAGPRLMTGTAVSHGGGGLLQTHFRLVVSEGRAPAMEGCTDDPPEALPARGTSLAHAALADALTDRALPDGHSLSDFISPGMITENGGTDSVHVMLSASGDILPLAPPDITAEEICAGRTGYRDAPVEMLNFKIMRFEGGTTLFVQRIEIETGKIIHQHEAVAAQEDQAAVTRVMTAGLHMLAAPVGGFSTGVD